MENREHVFISGKVQGVFFRSSTKEKAEELGLTGWVRNLYDGRVEAIFEGEKSSVEKMTEWCGRGPVHARVEEVKVITEPYKGDLKGFEIKRR